MKTVERSDLRVDWKVHQKQDPIKVIGKVNLATDPKDREPRFIAEVQIPVSCFVGTTSRERSHKHLFRLAEERLLVDLDEINNRNGYEDSPRAADLNDLRAKFDLPPLS